MIRNSLLLALGASLLALSPVSRAQNEEPPSLDSAIAIIRAGVLANKTMIIGQTMKFDDREGASFWPVYRSYEFERSKLEDERVDVIKEYSDKYPNLTDSETKAMSHRMFECDLRIAALKNTYFNKFNKVLPALRVAQFFQLERRVDLMFDMKVESTLPPLVQAQYNEESQ